MLIYIINLFLCNIEIIVSCITCFILCVTCFVLYKTYKSIDKYTILTKRIADEASNSNILEFVKYYDSNFQEMDLQLERIIEGIIISYNKSKDIKLLEKIEEMKEIRIEILNNREDGNKLLMKYKR